LKSVHRGAVNQRDVWQVEDASPKVTLNVWPAGEDIGGGGSITADLVPGGHESDVLHRVAAHCPASNQLCLEAGKKLFDGSQSSGEEGVYVPALRHRLAALAGRGEDLSLEDQNPVKAVGECTCSQESGDACTDHDRGV
jgi:hypothetical protein